MASADFSFEPQDDGAIALHKRIQRALRDAQPWVYRLGPGASSASYRLLQREDGRWQLDRLSSHKLAETRLGLFSDMEHGKRCVDWLVRHDQEVRAAVVQALLEDDLDWIVGLMVRARAETALES